MGWIIKEKREQEFCEELLCRGWSNSWGWGKGLPWVEPKEDSL